MSPDRESVAHLRHELRTPLNHIIGYGEMLLEDADDPAIASIEPQLTRIVGDAKRLLTQVNEHLAQGQVESGEFDLARLPEVLAAPADNLIDGANALTMAVADKSAMDATLSADLARITSAADHLRDLILHGVSARPALAAQAAQAIQSESGTRLLDDILTPAKTGAILVVDDNENNREMLQRRLEREGYHEVTLATDGAAALALLESRPFDLVLLDIMMPGINGYQVLEAMKSDPARRDIPVIMISALDDMTSVIRCIELGAED